MSVLPVTRRVGVRDGTLMVELRSRAWL